MNDRLKVFGIVALLGFMAGVIAQLTAVFVIPWIIAILPALGGLTMYVVAGGAGAVIAVGIVSAWAYLSGNKNRP
jgi:hypothetical protein